LIVASLILILIYNLHAIKNSKILSAFLLDIYSLATSIFDPVLCQEIPAPAPASAHTTFNRF